MSSEKKKSSASSSKASDYLVNLVWVGAVSYLISQFLKNAYIIRMQAIEEFGPVIHEFDPYFNWRATQVYTICCVLVICNTIHWSQFIINVTKILISLLITATHPTPPPNSTSTKMDTKSSSPGSTTRYGIPSAVPSARPFSRGCNSLPSFLKNISLEKTCLSMTFVVTSPLGLVLWRRLWWDSLPMRLVCR